MLLLTCSQSSISSLSCQYAQPQGDQCINTMRTRSTRHTLTSSCRGLASSRHPLICCSLTREVDMSQQTPPWILTPISFCATFPLPSPPLSTELSCHGRCMLAGLGFHSTPALPSHANTSQRGPEVHHLSLQRVAAPIQHQEVNAAQV